MMKKKKQWYDYLWIVSVIYLILGFVNIMFAWIGLICFLIPLLMAAVGGNKRYCNRYCGRGQLLSILGEKLRLSRGKDIPGFIKSKGFRYGFLIFFLVMFGNMLFTTYLVFHQATNLKEIVTLLWTFKLPWGWAYHEGGIPAWMVQFAFGFYSVMLTSTLLGLVTMVLYKPRAWCVYCPMGTMTQGICQLKNKD